MDTCKDLPETEIMAEYNRAEQLREIHRKKRELTAKKANGAIDKLLKTFGESPKFPASAPPPCTNTPKSESALNFFDSKWRLCRQRLMRKAI